MHSRLLNDSRGFLGDPEGHCLTLPDLGIALFHLGTRMKLNTVTRLRNYVRIASLPHMGFCFGPNSDFHTASFVIGMN